MIAVDVLAALVVGATLAALVADRIANARAAGRTQRLLTDGHAVELLPGGWPLHLSSCWCHDRPPGCPCPLGDTGLHRTPCPHAPFADFED